MAGFGSDWGCLSGGVTFIYPNPSMDVCAHVHVHVHALGLRQVTRMLPIVSLPCASSRGPGLLVAVFN